MSMRALEGLRILDLTQYIAGPYCTKLLAGLGADVIKIERPGGGDPARRMGPFAGDDPHPEKSGLFLHLNTGKKSITLNLKSKGGFEIFQELVRKADAVVESFHPGVMQRLGLGYEALCRINPSLVMTSISNFGQTGPYRDYKATEIVALAMGGYMHVVGDLDREPLKLGGCHALYQAGNQAAIGTMAALYCCEETGIGQQVDISIMEAVAFLLQSTPLSYFHVGEITMRAGPRLLGDVPHAHYPSTTLPCKDGYIHCHGKPWDWEILGILVEEPRLHDPKFKEAQRAHADEIDALMLPWLRERTRMEIMTRAQELNVPFCAVLNIDEVLKDPQPRARGYFVEVEHPVVGRVTQVGAPFKMSETPWETSRAPLLGEHNLEVFGQLLGYSREELVRLREEQVI